jgi:hypothetical protein
MTTSNNTFYGLTLETSKTGAAITFTVKGIHQKTGMVYDHEAFGTQAEGMIWMESVDPMVEETIINLSDLQNFVW